MMMTGIEPMRRLPSINYPANSPGSFAEEDQADKSRLGAFMFCSSAAYRTEYESCTSEER